MKNYLQQFRTKYQIFKEALIEDLKENIFLYIDDLFIIIVLVLGVVLLSFGIFSNTDFVLKIISDIIGTIFILFTIFIILGTS